MIEKPMFFEEAIRFLLEKDPNPAEWDSSEWALERPSVRVKSFFSARVENARFLDRAQGFLFDYMAGTTEKVVSPDGVESIALRAGGRAEFIRSMRAFMVQEGMAKPEEFASVNQNDLKDIRSVARLNLIFDTNVRSAYGYGNWRQGMKPAVRYRFPAARFIRTRGVMIPRIRHANSEGMVRLKTDRAWWAGYQNDPLIGGFGVPWPPYGFNSGMDQQDVNREEAKRLGLKVDRQPVENPEELPGLADTNTASVKKMDPAIKKKLLAEIDAKIEQAKAGKKSAADYAAERIAKMHLSGDDDMIVMQTGAPSEPGLTNVSSKLRIPSKLPIGRKDELDRALKAIDDVHGDGPLNVLDFIYQNKSGNGLAEYSPWEGSNHMKLLQLKHPELSIIHETGHWLDHFGFWTKGGSPTLYNKGQTSDLLREISKGWGSYGDEFKGFIKAAKASDAIKSVASDYRLSTKSRQYLLTNHEIFARAYAQWISRESGDAKLIGYVDADIQKTRDGYQAATQWEWQDFELVGKQLTSIFEARGWLRK